MKRILSIAVFLLVLHCIPFAQQWRPVLAGKTQYFIGPEVNTADSIIFGFRTSFSHVSGSDSVFTFNKIVRYNEPFDPYWHICGGDSTWITPDTFPVINFHQANIPGVEMVSLASGGQIFSLPLGDSIWLHPEYPIGQKWLYRNNTSDSAQVVLRTQQNLYGVMDSVVEISVSNGSSYQLSQNHGFVNWPFHLPIRDEAGNLAIEEGSLYRIPELGLGRHIPTFQDFVQLDAGDKFLIYDSEYANFNGHDWYDLHTVVSQVSTGDTVSYQTLLDRTEYSVIQPTTNDALIFVRDTLFSVLPGEMPKPFFNVFGAKAGYHQYYKKLSDYEGRIASYQPRIFLSDSCATYGYPNNEIGYFMLSIYAEGLGRIRYRNDLNVIDANPMSYYNRRDLLCYQKVGEPLHGDCDSSFQYIAVDDPISQHTFSLYPNPANQSVTLEFETESPETFFLTLTDLRGAVLVEQEINDQSVSLAVNHLPNGLYLVAVRNKSGAGVVKKLNIQH